MLSELENTTLPTDSVSALEAHISKSILPTYANDGSEKGYPTNHERGLKKDVLRN